MAITVKPFTDVIGAEILGVDLSKEIDAQTMEEVHQAWLDHLVIVFRGQELSEADEIRFCSYFGPPVEYDRDRFAPLAENPNLVVTIGNIKVDGKVAGTLPDGDMTLHQDSVWMENPPKGTLLYAIEVPKAGGETLFVNLYKAYETLPQDLKDYLADKTAINSYELGARYKGDEGSYTDAHSYNHPAIINHSETGKPLIFINRLMTVGFEGVPEDEANEVLERVFTHCENPALRFEHSWLPGDALLWDNRCTLHGRNDFNPNERRYLKRVTIEGDGKPVPAKQAA